MILAGSLSHPLCLRSGSPYVQGESDVDEGLVQSHLILVFCREVAPSLSDWPGRHSFAHPLLGCSHSLVLIPLPSLKA
jgi:hypothetical protein